MAEKNQKSDFVDVFAIVKDWLSHWYLFVISVIGCVALGYFYTTIRQPKYQVNANLLISQAEDNPLQALGDIGSLFGGNGDVEDEVFIVKSHTVLRDVAKALQTNKRYFVKTGFMKKRFAYNDYPVEIFYDPARTDTLRSSFRFRVNVNDKGNVKVQYWIDGKKKGIVESPAFPVTVNTAFGDFVLNKTKYYASGEPMRTDIYFMGYDASAEVLAEDISIDIASKKSNVILMSIKTPNIQFGKDLLNSIITKYNEQGKATKTKQANQTAQFIEDRLVMIQDDLKNSEKNIEDYKNNSGIVDVAAEAEANLRRREEYDAKVVSAQTQLELLTMTRDFLNNPRNAYTLIPVSGDMEAASLQIGQYNDLVLKRLELENNAKTNNVALKNMNDQIDALRETILSTITLAISQQRTAVSDLRGQLAKAESKLGTIPEQERRFRDILRQQKVQEELYIFLLERREETAMMAANALDKGVIVDEAYALNNSLGMKKKMVLIFAFFIGLLLPPFYLYGRKMLRNKFSTREEVERMVDVPVLGEVCTSRQAKENPMVVRPQTTSAAAELFRLIRTNLGFMLRNRDGKVVLVTSTKSGEGKTFIAINLAASLALLGKKVLLVGMDIRSPKLTEYLNVNSRRGLTEYLSTPDMDVNDLIIRDKVAENLDVITAGPVPPNPSELLAEPIVDEFVREMRQRYEYVIIDSAPVGMVSDTFTLDRLADATIYVCRANYTPISDLEFINQIRRQERLKNMAIVVNGTAGSKGYGYGYNDRGKRD